MQKEGGKEKKALISFCIEEKIASEGRRKAKKRSQKGNTKKKRPNTRQWEQKRTKEILVLHAGDPEKSLFGVQNRSNIAWPKVRPFA